MLGHSHNKIKYEMVCFDLSCNESCTSNVNMLDKLVVVFNLKNV